MPLFSMENGQVAQIPKSRFKKEKEIQSLFENNLHILLNINFIKSEHSTGKHGGRIDTLGLDENGFPVIIEYKKSENDSVLNQGLYYLDWLVDHKGDFELLVREKSLEIPVNWNNVRLILVAEKFNKFDKHAVNRIGGEIELMQFTKYGEGLLYIEQINEGTESGGKNKYTKQGEKEPLNDNLSSVEYTIDEHLDNKTDNIKELFNSFREAVMTLGDDVEEKVTKQYIAYKTNRNFAEVVVQAKSLKVYLDVKENQLNDSYNITEDCSSIGHWATGNRRFNLQSLKELDAAVDLVRQSYELTV
ncbi:MAG: DUF5655 domain-containing protein [Clostridiales bacterium]|nr:DUF5655 domain-containing protein [Clostridiales bacterium]MCF8021078.1 DUF5655 domain-containing protein [Clostridiales bacterium]